MTAHPGRLQMLIRAARDHDVGPQERAALIRYGAPDHDPERVYEALAEYVRLLRAFRRAEAVQLITSLTQPAKEE